MKKGLRPLIIRTFGMDTRQNRRPDEEGIKTIVTKRMFFEREVRTVDLMKKGLRRDELGGLALLVESEP